MISVLLSKLVLLGFGILYPAYASYKTVKTKSVRDYVTWMMYWIVFALYTCIEIFTDIFLSFWFPFYYEFKILFVLWLICPATRGSTYVFRKFINPLLSRYESVLDAYISSSLDHGYDVLKKLGAQIIDYLNHFVIELLNKGQNTAVSVLPKLSEMAQNDTVIQSIQRNSPSNSLDCITLEDEDFDVLEVKSSKFHSNVVATSSPQMALGEYQTSSSESESEDLVSVKKRPLKVAAKKKAKVSGLRERKKREKNASST